MPDHGDVSPSGFLVYDAHSEKWDFSPRHEAGHAWLSLDRIETRNEGITPKERETLIAAKRIVYRLWQDPSG